MASVEFCLFKVVIIFLKSDLVFLQVTDDVPSNWLRSKVKQNFSGILEVQGA